MERWRSNSNRVVTEHDAEFCKRLPVVSPLKDPYEEECIAEAAVWKDILGVNPIYWDGNTAKVSKSNRDLVEDAWKNHVKYEKEASDYRMKIKKLNSTLKDMDEEFDSVNIHPRSPYPRCLYWWHQMFRMTNTKPTSIVSKRFTEPGACEYVSTELLQFFSLRFAGDLSRRQTMSVYGFMAVRDDIDQLRNYVFNRSRDLAQEISTDSPDLLLTPPARGISASYNLMVEYNLKVKNNDSDAKEDEELIDGCFEFKQSPLCWGVQLQNVRLFGPLGPVDVRFALLKCAVEAVIDIKVKRAIGGYKLSTVTASTCGYSDKIMLYDSLMAFPVTKMKYNGPSSMVAVASAVVAVELGCELKIEITTMEYDCGLGRHVRKKSHELLFSSKKHNSSKGAIIMGNMLKVSVKVTWSTMGKYFLPAFPSNWSLLGEKPGGPCSHE